MKRREFLSKVGLGVGTTALGINAPSCGPAETAPAPPAGPFRAYDRVSLGRTGIQVSRLGCGTGTVGYNHQSHQSALGIRGLADLLIHGYDQGLTFWDSADSYGTHPHLAEALKTVPRDKVVIQTKTDARTYTAVQADVERFLDELNTSYIDSVLLHAIGLNEPEGNWTQTLSGAMQALSEAKQKGLVRAVGCSVHSLDALRAAAASPWVEVQLVRLNCTGSPMDADNATVISVLNGMRAAGKGVAGIKILSEGNLRNRVDEALKYACTAGVLDSFLIGAESILEQNDLARRIAAVTV